MSSSCLHSQLVPTYLNWLMTIPTTPVHPNLNSLMMQEKKSQSKEAFLTILYVFWSRCQLAPVGLPHHPSTPFLLLREGCTVVQPDTQSCYMAAGGHQCRTVICDAHCQNSGTGPPVKPGNYIDVYQYSINDNKEAR